MTYAIYILRRAQNELAQLPGERMSGFVMLFVFSAKTPDHVGALSCVVGRGGVSG
jgi:hypothetical protein